MSDNRFQQELLQGLAVEEQAIDFSLALTGEGWLHRGRPGVAAPPALLAGRALAADVNDHGAILMPQGSSWRAAVDWAFDGGSGPGPVPDIEYLPGALVRRSRTGHEEWCSVDAHEAVLIVRLQGLPARVRLALTVQPASVDPHPVLDGLWLQVDQHPPLRPELTYNNSRVPDPPAPAPSGPTAVYACLLDADGAGVALVPSGRRRRTALLADRPESVTTVAYAWSSSPAVLLLTCAADPAEAAAAVDRIRTRGDVGRPEGSGLGVTTPDPLIDKQAAFAVANTLGARAAGERGDIFVHGRRGHGYADVSHLHQSYMMHFPALLAGAGASVRDELTAFLELQEPDGALLRCPRPGTGSHLYVGTYTNAHLPLALERYLAWTGDFGFLHEEIAGRSVLDRLRAACDWLLASRVSGLIAPCGWLDAWNPDVIAQGQTSIAAVLGLQAAARILDHGGGSGADLRAAADELAAAVRDRLWSADTGLFAENVLASGAVEGNGITDFFAHTQVWAAAAGLAPDLRGLDAVRALCLADGVQIVPPTVLDRPYLADSTDGDTALELDSTATWLLARWPELTHLYAIACCRHGRPDDALDAVRRQLPARLHQRRGRALPYFYAEKYLQPGDQPWLCTWAGDPSLLEAVVSGLLGIDAGLEGLTVRPHLPAAWRHRPSTLQAVYRGGRLRVRIEPGDGVPEVLLDGAPVDASAALPLGPGDHSLLVTVPAA